MKPRNNRMKDEKQENKKKVKEQVDADHSFEIQPKLLPLHTGSLSFQWGLLGSTHSIVPEPCSMTKPGEQVKVTVVPS